MATEDFGTFHFASYRLGQVASFVVIRLLPEGELRLLKGANIRRGDLRRALEPGVA